MARPLRLEFPGAVYHVTSRGNGDNAIYANDEDRHRFLSIFAAVVKRFGWRCHSYCLLDNHYHLLIETPRGNLAAGMRQLNGTYTQAFNRAHKRRGHLFQGRYRSILIEKEAHLLALCRYLVGNPVAIGLVGAPHEWPWSSYRALAGEAPVPPCLYRDWVLGQFAAEEALACRAYAHFVYQAEVGYRPWSQLTGGVLLGGETFLDSIKPLLTTHRSCREIPEEQRLMDRPALRSLVANIADKPQRQKAVYEAHTVWRYTLAEIGDVLGVHYSTISRMVKKAEHDLITS